MADLVAAQALVQRRVQAVDHEERREQVGDLVEFDGREHSGDTRQRGCRCHIDRVDRGVREGAAQKRGVKYSVWIQVGDELALADQETLVLDAGDSLANKAKPRCLTISCSSHAFSAAARIWAPLLAMRLTAVSTPSTIDW